MLLIHGVSSSRLTWWRVERDLVDLGWQVQTVDMLGHGDRAELGPDPVQITDLASDVLEQLPRRVDLVVGHSLGAIVALTAAQLSPDYTGALVLEDPPGLSGALDLDLLADRMATTVQATRSDPAAAAQEDLQEHPTWSAVDASNSVQNRLRLDLSRVSQLLRSGDWDLPDLVSRCPVPLHLLVAASDSALLDPDRMLIMKLLPKDRVRIIDSGHDIHRDRPAIWLREVERFAARMTS